MKTNAIAEHIVVKVNSNALLRAETWMCVFGVGQKGWGGSWRPQYTASMTQETFEIENVNIMYTTVHVMGVQVGT